MNNNQPKNEITTIAPEVLTTITRLAALSVEGVSRLDTIPGGVNRLFPNSGCSSHHRNGRYGCRTRQHPCRRRRLSAGFLILAL
jgi:hypothetical protein